uniref:Uncharacterized protein n=1 Tax=viral metagenome TaxID=1070528 RepID=A0A6C0HGS3_9ZZZZ
MGRFRTFANDQPRDFNQYYNKKNGETIYKYARTHTVEYNNMINPNFLMNNVSIPTHDHDHDHDNYHLHHNIQDIDINNCKNSKGIAKYKDYQTLIILSKTASYLNPECNLCADVPTQLNDGLKSEICYNNLYKTYNINPCNGKTIIPIIDACKEKSGIPYPYGAFNNKTKNPPIEIHSIKDLQPCQSQLHCQTYKFCKCPTWLDCKFCNYKVVTPLDEETNIVYTVKNANNNDNTNEHMNDDVIDEHNETNETNDKNEDDEIDDSNIPLFMRVHLKQLNQLKREQQLENMAHTEDAINIFSKTNI